MTTDVQYLEWELERYREAEERRTDEAIRARHERERERQEQFDAELRTADNWRDALGNQAALFGREAYLDDEVHTYFTDGRDACQRAIELWPQVEATKEEYLSQLRQEIHRLEAEIESVQDAIAAEVGQRLMTDPRATVTSGWTTIAEAMIQGVSSFYDWLNW